MCWLICRVPRTQETLYYVVVISPVIWTYVGIFSEMQMRRVVTRNWNIVAALYDIYIYTYMCSAPRLDEYFRR